MSLPVIDLPPALAVPAQPLPLPAADRLGWLLQVQRASADLAAPRPPLAGSDRADLESCGFPLTEGAPQLVRAAPQPAAPAAPGEALPPRAGGEEAAERAALRVHVQGEAADGLRIWLGIDGDAALVAQRAGPVLGALRRSQPAGARIVSVVCNGVPVYPRPALESSLVKEAPWPSVR
jgi:hypothetical protein